MLFCHFLIMNSLGTTTTLCVSQQHSSPKVCLLLHNYRGLSITWRIKRKRPWTFSWTRQNFVYEEKRCPEIMKSCDHFFKFFWQSISIYKQHVLYPFLEVMIYSVTLISFRFSLDTNKPFMNNRQRKGNIENLNRLSRYPCSDLFLKLSNILS